MLLNTESNDHVLLVQIIRTIECDEELRTVAFLIIYLFDRSEKRDEDC